MILSLDENPKKVDENNALVLGITDVLESNFNNFNTVVPHSSMSS